VAAVRRFVRLRIAVIIEAMTAAGLPDGAMDRILEVLQPEQVWLFGSPARETRSASYSA
jgi:polyphosphate kinase 2 (PPK2 family)